MYAPPLAVILGIAGVIGDRCKVHAVAGIVVGGLTCLLWLLPALCR